MPRNKVWTKEENKLLKGVLEQYGEKPTKWPEEVKRMIKARLAQRSESGIYQQALKLLKTRASADEAQTAEQQGFFISKGA